MYNLRILVGSLALSLCLLTNMAFAAVAGEVTLITGRGTATNNGVIRALTKGDPVYSGEIISSGINSYLNIKFADGGFILLRPNSRFKIENFAYIPPEDLAKKAAKPAPPAGAGSGMAMSGTSAPPQAANSTSSAFFRLLKGGFRAVSGLVGHVDRNEYRVSTPVATIGIRGTDYVVVLCDAPCANDPVLTDTLPKGSSAEDGVVVGVISGGVFVANLFGLGSELGEGKYLVNLPDGTQFELPFEPKFLRVDPIPNPAHCGT
jgi:hypothetical protein